ncbi:profilin, partial [Scleroderma citrinum]
FVDKGLLEGGFVREAAILGLDDQVWAQSTGCNISRAEHAAIVDGLSDPPLREISVGGRKYRCTMSTLDMVLGTCHRRGMYVTIRKMNMAVIVAEYESDEEKVLRGVDDLAEYLIRMGY